MLETKRAIVVQKPVPGNRKLPVFRSSSSEFLLELQQKSNVVLQTMTIFQLHDNSGGRKYLTIDERDRFLTSAKSAERKVRTFCFCLAFTGCRISEALELTADRIDLAEKSIAFRSLKKRRSGIFRAVPVPDHVLESIDLVHAIRNLQKLRSLGQSVRLWPWNRSTGWRHVARVMAEAEISGPQASPKGLRHGFGVAAVQSGVQLNLVQKWLGHADLSTTSIYTDAIGAEEREIAARMWK